MKHFSPQDPKTKKSIRRKFILLQKTKSRKNFLYFLKRKLFLYFGKQKPQRKFLIFQETEAPKKLFIFYEVNFKARK